MFIQFFKNNNPSLFVLLPLFAVVLWISSFISPAHFQETNCTLLYAIVSKPLTTYYYVSTFTSFLLLIAEALLLHFIVIENEIITKRSFLPALFYIVFMSNNESMRTLHPSLIANLFILFGLNRIFSSFRKNNAFSNAFDAGLFLSIASLFYFPSIFLFPLIGIGLIIFRTFNWREWIIAAFGIFIPYIFILSYYFWNNQLQVFWNSCSSYFVLHDKPSFDYPTSFYSMLLIGLVIGLLALSKVPVIIRSGSQKTKKNLTFINWLFLFSMISFSIAPSLISPYFAALAIPLSIYTANYFLSMKKEWLGELLFLLFLITILINDFSKYL